MATWAEDRIVPEGGSKNQGERVEEVEKWEKGFEEGIIEAGCWERVRDVGMAGLGENIS